MKRLAAVVFPALFALSIGAACSNDDEPDARIPQPSFPDAPLEEEIDAGGTPTVDAGGGGADAGARDAAASDAGASDAAASDAT